MPRVNEVQHARKPQTCGKCGAEVKKGDPYRWLKPRYGGKKIRCEKSDCRFRDSDKTSSDKLARIYDARDSAHDQIDAWEGEDTTDLESILEECATEAREVADEYREAASAWNDQGPGEEWNEKADEIEGWADSMESVSFEDYEKPDDAKAGDTEERAEWRDEQRQTARDTIEECPV